MSIERPAILEVPGGPFPGAGLPVVDTTAQHDFVVGGYAECYLFGAVVANLFDWRIKPVFDFSNLTAHGEYWQTNAFLDAGWTAQARGYLTLLGATYLLPGSSPTHALAATTFIPNLITFTGYSTLGNVTGGNAHKVWEATCFIKDAELLVPEALFVQEINLIGSGVPGIIG